MVKCNNPKCGAVVEGSRYTICRKCGYVVYPIPCVEDNAFEKIDETYMSDNKSEDRQKVDPQTEKKLRESFGAKGKKYRDEKKNEESIKRGLFQKATIDRGSFAKYTTKEIDDGS
jgi:hypothetical protein